MIIIPAIALALIGAAAVAQTTKGYRAFQERAAKGPPDPSEALTWKRRWFAAKALAACVGLGVVLILGVLISAPGWIGPWAGVYGLMGVLGVVGLVAAMFI